MIKTTILNNTDYLERIEADAIEQMPLIQFEGEVIVVDKHAQIKDAIAFLSAQPLLGIDTETRPSFKKGVVNKVSLIQVATEKVCYLFRLNKVGFPEGLMHIFESESIMKIGLSLDDDMRGLRRFRHFKSENLVDLQKIVQNFGILDLSLKKVSAIVLGGKVSKGQQLSDWECESLRPSQIRYAATDAWACLMIYKKLNKID